MPLPEAFWEELPHKSDVELYEVLLQRGAYLPEAVAAVQEEIRKRNLSRERLTEIAAAAAEAQMLAAQLEKRECQKRRLGKFAFHVFLWLAIPLGLLLKALISLLIGP
jgi:hypothetical protein